MTRLLLLAACCAGATGQVVLNPADGSLTARAPDGVVLWRTGPEGLWRVVFEDRFELTAAAPGVTRTVAGDRWIYRHERLEVILTGRPTAGGLELTATLTPRRGTVLDVALPATLRFEPATVTRFVFPHTGNDGVGLAFSKRFFSPQGDDPTAGWEPTPLGPRGYQALYGGSPTMGPDNPEPRAPRLTDAGRRLLKPETRTAIERLKVIVNRAPQAGQIDETLVDTDDGPWLSGCALGGRGRLWRPGGGIRTEQAPALQRAWLDLLAGHLAAGDEIGLWALDHGPSKGGWAEVEVETWRTALRALPGVRLVELTSPTELSAALASGRLKAVLNPYGEWLPTSLTGDPLATVTAIRDWVRAGGWWFECGGYSFYYALRPRQFLRRSAPYPSAFADFMHLTTPAGTVAVYGVQPFSGPWSTTDMFVPGRLACGGDERGGWCERQFATHIKEGATWTSPRVRLTVGRDAFDAVRDYAAANRIDRPLSAKVKPEPLARLKSSVLLKYNGNAAEKLKYLDRLPAGTLVHFSDYLHGGFDKQYPDHLPPHPDFGTAAEFRRFLDECRRLGHLSMPYTNPTWWCDGPKGPTFEREGDAPLLRQLNGSLSREQYGTNFGWSTCLWHPAVRAVNAVVRRQFTEDYPVDVLFQDQNGARSWRYDTNPASPRPDAYMQAMISMTAEDSLVVPLSTEGGWDQVANWETQLCGMGFGIVPSEGGPAWRRLLLEELPGDAWTVFPLAQLLVHDKCLMIYHDLGQFTTLPRVVPWTLGLGFQMSYVCSASAVASPHVAGWLAWLDRLQKSVGSRYSGQPVVAFQHRRRNSPAGHGLIEATYGPVELLANLEPEPLTTPAAELAGYGFRVTAPGLVAGRYRGEEPLQFVAETTAGRTEVWFYGRANAPALAELPGPLTGPVKVTFADGTVREAVGPRLELRLPDEPTAPAVRPPAELAGLPPRQWPGGPPRIGVLNLPGWSGSWTTLTAAQWLEQLTTAGLPVEPLTDFAAARAALAAGPRRYLAIVNPYTEAFPKLGDTWQASLDLLRAYVTGGGSWIETGGYSFFLPRAADGATENIGGGGLGYLGLPIASGAVDEPPVPVSLTETGRQWLGADFAGRLAGLTTQVNRGLPLSENAIPATVLIEGGGNGFLGGYRLGGWGYLWRLGGFHPQPEIALPAVARLLRHLLDNPPAEPAPAGVRRLWQAVVTPAG